MSYIIYLLTDNLNGKIYIGYTKNSLNKRWPNSRINCKFGHSNFNREVLRQNLSLKEAKETERHLINEHDSTNPEIGYNINQGGGGPTNHTLESKRKMSNSHKGKTHSDEAKRKIGEASSERRKGKPSPNKGKPMKECQKEKISKALKGRKPSSDNLIDWSGKKGESHPRFGVKHSKISKDKISESNSPLSADDVLEIRRLAAEGESHKNIAKRFPIKVCSVGNIVYRKTWKHI